MSVAIKAMHASEKGKRWRDIERYRERERERMRQRRRQTKGRLRIQICQGIETEESDILTYSTC